MYPSFFVPKADKEKLLNEFRGKNLNNIATPAFVIDKQKFISNCHNMLDSAYQLDADFRAHMKTHKTIEGAEIQLGSEYKFQYNKIVISTLAEGWSILPLAEKGIVKDVLYGVPFPSSRIEELSKLSIHFEKFRLMVDNSSQLESLMEFNHNNPKLARKWSVFIKLDVGTLRCGVKTETARFNELLQKLAIFKKDIELYGFYCHAGHSYSVDSFEKAKKLLFEEIIQANKAAWSALEVFPGISLQLSVGATPTAHASQKVTLKEIDREIGELAGKLELHAGNYPCCDLQQLSTNCIDISSISCKVLADVISSYPERGNKFPGEQLINAGVIALTRESSSFPGHGLISEPKEYRNWIVGRVSQEHGILVPYKEAHSIKFIPESTRVSIIPQHACITAQSFPWYYIVNGSETIEDIWVPAHGW